jgi:hypothetical protein
MILEGICVKPVRCPARAPNCNALAERFVRSIKEECLDRMILFGEASLRRALRAYARVVKKLILSLYFNTLTSFVHITMSLCLALNEDYN